jgi:CRISPR/Cas system-associated exonuclease Cas4 (RecB family)
VSSDGSGTRFTTRVADIEGTWSDPPAWWSFSSLSEVEACPRRWSLSRANYPGVWDRPGYPEYIYVGTLVGHVIHGSLEVIIRELVRAGCTTVEDASAVDVLRSVGGYSQLLRDQVEVHLSRLADNPRCAERLDQLQRDLLTRLPELRQSVQALVARSEFTASDSNASRAGSAGGRLADGTYPEFEVRSDELSFSGRIDLLTISGQRVHITDYKSGEPSAAHEDLLRTYATLWARRSDPDPDRPHATRLTISYVTQDVEVAPPEPEEIDRLARELRDRVRDATAALTSAHPVAKPAAETCRFCSVRHLCEDYWRAVERPLKSGAADIEVEVVARNGPRSWLVRTQAEEEGILRTSESDDLREGRRQRLLGAFISPTEGDDEPLTISLSANTETYLLREDGAV